MQQTQRSVNTKAERTATSNTERKHSHMKHREFSNYSPLNLQFFAEETPSGADDNTNPDNNSDNSDETGKNEGGNENPSGKSYEDALAEIAAAQAEVKKLKAERDNALKKSGEATKALRAKMTEAELEAEKKQAEDEEKAAHLKELEDYKAQNEALKRYRIQGMDEELAAKAAKAEIEGDMDELANIQAQHTKALIKEKEAEWKASRPKAQMGDGEDSNMTKEEILAIKDPKERQIAIAKNLKSFENH